MPGYKHPCRYCNQFIPPNSNRCPLCGKVRPLGPLRCPRCAAPIRKGWIKCNSCGQSLQVVCPACGKDTFFGDYCEHCDHHMVVVCPHRKCRAEQPPLGEKCIKCGRPLK